MLLRLLHSSQYRTSADLEGDRVLVVGAGNSGCDLAVDAVHARRQVSIAMRRGQVFQPKTFFGKGRNQLPLLAKLPPAVAETVARAVEEGWVGVEVSPDRTGSSRANACGTMSSPSRSTSKMPCRMMK